jgi:hypothetical protein
MMQPRPFSRISKVDMNNDNDIELSTSVVSGEYAYFG